MDANGPRPPEQEIAAFAELVADVERMSLWVRSMELSYADELAINFAAPCAQGG